MGKSEGKRKVGGGSETQVKVYIHNPDLRKPMELHRVGGCSSRVIYIHPIKMRLTSRSFPSEEKEEKGPGFRDLHICDILLIGNRSTMDVFLSIYQ